MDIRPRNDQNHWRRQKCRQINGERTLYKAVCHGNTEATVVAKRAIWQLLTLPPPADPPWLPHAPSRQCPRLQLTVYTGGFAAPYPVLGANWQLLLVARLALEFYICTSIFTTILSSFGIPKKCIFGSFYEIKIANNSYNGAQVRWPWEN